MHIKTFHFHGPGEGTIYDLVLFSEAGKLADVERRWTAVKKYSVLVDRSHSQALRGVREFLHAQGQTQPATEAELEEAILASMELEALDDADVLVKALIFLLLDAFVQFGVKEVHKLVKPDTQLPSQGAYTRIRRDLKRIGVWPDEQGAYKEHYDVFRDPVRNNLAHGDWAALAHKAHTLDLTKAFIAVARFFVSIQHKLFHLGYDA